MRRFTVGLLIVVSAVCLVLSSTSLWTRRHVVNTDVFIAGGQAILADPAVQGAIDAKVVDTIMVNPEVNGAVNDVVALLPPRLQRFKPALEDEARDLLSSGVHAVLTSDRFSLLTETALRSVQTQLLAGQPVRFTLGQAKARIPQQDRTGLAGEVINLIPDDVGFTVLTPQQAPQLYTAIDLLKTLWLWVGLLGLAALIGALVISRRRRRTLRAWSVTTAVLGLLLVIAMRVAQGPLLIHVKPANAAAATAIYEGVTASLRAWTLWFVAIPAVVLVFTLLWGRLGIIPGIRRGYRAAVEQVRSRREAHELAQDAAIDGTDPRPAESWTHRVAADTRTFIDGVGMSSWLDRLGGFVRAPPPLSALGRGRGGSAGPAALARPNADRADLGGRPDRALPRPSGVAAVPGHRPCLRSRPGRRGAARIRGTGQRGSGRLPYTGGPAGSSRDAGEPVGHGQQARPAHAAG